MKKIFKNIKSGFAIGLTTFITLFLCGLIYAVVNNIWTTPEDLEAKPGNTLSADSWNAILSNENFLSGSLNSVNSEIITLSGILTTTNNTINALNTKVNSLSGSLNSVNSEIATLSEVLTTTNNIVNALNTKVDSLSGTLTALKSEVASIGGSFGMPDYKNKVALSSLPYTATFNCLLILSFIATGDNADVNVYVDNTRVFRFSEGHDSSDQITATIYLAVGDTISFDYAGGTKATSFDGSRSFIIPLK